MVKLSIAIKTFNHASYIADCLNSVLNQDFVDFEVVVTDDASTDGTPDIIRQFSDPRIRLSSLPRNLGISGAMNETIAQCRGEYIAILNSDDIALPGRLSHQVRYLDEHPGIGALFGFPILLQEDGNPSGKVWPCRTPRGFSQAELLRHFFIYGNFLCAPTAMLRRSAYGVAGDYDGRLINLQDFDMWVRFAQHNIGIQVLPRPYAGFRIRSGLANESALRRDTRIRLILESAEVFRRYLSLDGETIQAAFAEDFRAGPADDASAQWKLARFALRGPLPAHRLFGWRSMYEMASTPGQFKELRNAAPAVDIFGLQLDARRGIAYRLASRCREYVNVRYRRRHDAQLLAELQRNAGQGLSRPDHSRGA